MTVNAKTSAAVPRRILAICYELPPAAYPQAIQIGRLLANSRHTIGAVCGPEGHRPDCGVSRTERNCSRFIVEDKSRRWPTLDRFARRFLPFYGAIPDEHRDWAKRAAPLLLGSDWINALLPEAIVSFGQPMSDHLLGLALKRRLGLPWIAHFSDPWADNPFRRPHKLAKALNRRLEARVVSQADALIFTSSETMALFAARYGRGLEKMAHILPHCFDPGLYKAKAQQPNPTLVVRYLGNFYGRRTPLPVLRAIEWLNANMPDVAKALRFEFVGAMPTWMKLLPEIRRSDPRLVTFRPSVGYQLSLDLMVDADLLLVVDAPAQTSPFLPSKLIDYLGAARPILGAVPPGPSQRLIAELGGWTASPDRPADIALALADFVASSSKRHAMIKAIEVIATRYTAEVVSRHFDAIITQLLDSVGTSGKEMAAHG